MKSSVFFAKKKLVRFVLFCFLSTVFLTVSCSPSKNTNAQNRATSVNKNSSPAIGAQTRFLLNTVCTINLYNDGSTELYNEIFDRIAQIEQDFSAHIDTSFISQINSASGKHAIAVPDDVLFVINAAIEYARITDGAFDPTVGILVKLWGINTDSEHVPTQAEIDATLPLINWRDIEVTNNNIFLRREGMSIDLGGIAKGFAADETVRILRKRNVAQAIIDLGGNIYAFGKKADSSAWRIGIKNPDAPDGNPALILTLDNSSVVTSGVYERFFIEDNIRYHHILDTHTGYPAQTGLLSTTIVCESSMTADALSTSIFLLGKDRGLELLEKIATQKSMDKALGLNADVAGVFIAEGGNVTASATLQKKLAPTAGYSGKIAFN